MTTPTSATDVAPATGVPATAIGVGDLRPILAALPALLFGFDRDGVCTLSEGGLLAALGFEPGENVGRDVADLQERFPEIAGPVGRCLRGETLVTHTTVPGYDGSFSLLWTPTRDEHGEVSGLVVLSSENDRAGDGDAVHQIREEYRTLLSAFPDHVLRFSAGELVTVKPPRDGSDTLPEPTWVPRPVEDLLPWDSAARIGAAVQVALAAGGEQIVEYGPAEGSGAAQWFEARILREDEEQALLIVREVTARHQMENELREATKLEALGRLAAGVAHEINTPVQFVSHNVEFMGRAFDSMHQLLVAYRHALSPGDPRPWMERAEELATAEQVHDVDFLLSEVPPAVDEALDGMRRVTTIVQAMRVFSHPAARELSPADLNEAVRNAVVVTTSEHKHVASIDLDLDDDLPPVPCVVGEVAQVLLNLIVNAAQALESGAGGRGGRGTITIATRTHDEVAIIRVSDDGPGIPYEDQPHVFDPFFTTKDVGVGTGQGLTLARSIVVGKHGGQLALASTPGEGTTLEVRLPIAGPPGAPGTPR